MEKFNYQKFAEYMELRDYLALDRTLLSNERTLLAYMGSFVGFMSAGVGMVTILDFTLTTVLGGLFIAAAPTMLTIGIIRYFIFKKRFVSLFQAMRNSNIDPNSGH